MFKLKIETDNAAFEDTPALEVARILRHVADRLEYRDETKGKTMDSNGNSVGSWKLED